MDAVQLGDVAAKLDSGTGLADGRCTATAYCAVAMVPVVQYERVSRAFAAAPSAS